jgi:hypothetical protein
MSTQLNAAQLKDLRQTALWTINDTGVGVVELSRWVVRAKLVHSNISDSLSAGFSKRNQKLADLVVESLEHLNAAIERIESHIELEASAKSKSNVINLFRA